MKKPPAYVKLSTNGTVMSHRGDMFYWRRAGVWGLEAKWNDEGELVGGECYNEFEEPTGLMHLDGVPLLEATYEEWQKSNFTSVFNDKIETDSEGNITKIIMKGR